jgi:hypothetical protein
VVRKGQVTIFIILGIFIVVFVALFFVFATLDRSSTNEVIQAPVVVHIKQCVEDAAVRAIPYLSTRGGFYSYPDEYLVYTQESSPLFAVIPYYYKEGELFFPSQETLEDQFSLFLLNTTSSCSQNITGYALEQQKQPAAKAVFSEESVEITYDPGIAIVAKGSTTTIGAFTFEIPTNYLKAYETAIALTQEENAKGNIFCLSCLEKYKEGVIQTLETEEIAFSPYYAIIYSINFTEPTNDATAHFIFAGRYASETASQTFKILPIADQQLFIGYPYQYHVETTMPFLNVTFTDNSDSFDIDPDTGIISFTPLEEDIGNQLVEITAKTVNSKMDSTFFYLNITSFSNAATLPYIGTLAAPVGDLFTYNITITENQTVYYTDDSDLFDIGITSGKISFTPTETDIGTHTISITATNAHGASTTQEMNLVIY